MKEATLLVLNEDDLTFEGKQKDFENIRLIDFKNAEYINDLFVKMVIYEDGCKAKLIKSNYVKFKGN